MRVIVAGTRTFTDYEFLKKKCDEILDKTSPHVIICGMARGTDLLGKRYAEEKGYPVIAKPLDKKT